MSNFMQFYANGGVFNHFVTLFMSVGVIALLLHGRARKLGSHGTKRLVLAERMAVICLLTGLCGSLFGFIEMCGALGFIEPDARLEATLRAMTIVPITLAWALMCAIPMLTASAISRFRQPPKAPVQQEV